MMMKYIFWQNVKKRMPKVNSWVKVKNDSKEDVAFFIDYLEGYYFCIGHDVKQSWTPTHWKYIRYHQPERLNEKTSKEDAIVCTHR